METNKAEKFKKICEHVGVAQNYRIPDARLQRPNNSSSDGITLQKLKAQLSDDYLYARLYDRSVDYKMRLKAVESAEQRFRVGGAPERTRLERNGAVVNEKGWIIPERRPRQSLCGVRVVGQSDSLEPCGYDAAKLCCIELTRVSGSGK